MIVPITGIKPTLLPPIDTLLNPPAPNTISTSLPNLAKAEAR